MVLGFQLNKQETSRGETSWGQNVQLPWFLLSDCLLLDVTPSLLPALAHGTTYRSMSPQQHLCSPAENN